MSAAEDPNKHFINSFHNACASASLPKPVYENSFDEALNGGTWTSIVYVNKGPVTGNVEYGRGTGKQKKDAQHAAAKEALQSVKNDSKFAAYFPNPTE